MRDRCVLSRTHGDDTTVLVSISELSMLNEY
jgi:hypothetical protein